MVCATDRSALRRCQTIRRRFSSAKKSSADSPYERLLPPKTGGMAFVLGEIGNRIDQVIDVTISYPGKTPSFWQFLCGECRVSTVHVEGLETPVAGDRQTLDDSDIDTLKQWTLERWQQKDERLASLRKKQH